MRTTGNAKPADTDLTTRARAVLAERKPRIMAGLRDKWVKSANTVKAMRRRGLITASHYIEDANRRSSYGIDLSDLGRECARLLQDDAVREDEEGSATDGR